MFTRATATGLAVAGGLIALAGVTHPRADTDKGLDHVLASMLTDAAWTPAHLISLAGFALLGGVLFSVVRSGRVTDDRLRAATWLAVIASAVAVAELVPHVLAKAEASEVAAGGDTPLTDLHVALQAIASPLVGIAVAVLAGVGASTGLVGNRVLAALAVVGGLAWASAGPAIAITENPKFAPLFIGGVGMSAWLIGSGFLAYRDASRSQLAPAA